ncbi:hypothetical protein V8V75_17625 [Peribacillus frigoritolerans]|uniref:hypothetical protein n=1 Tax=Peribacillus frigoritolerans TaxID=450367 RepID=UPI0030081CC6
MLEVVLEIIKEFEGKEFRQTRGAEFHYKVNGNVLELSRTNQSISKGTIKEALVHVPLKNATPLQKLRVTSYLFAILMDNRIRSSNW